MPNPKPILLEFFYKKEKKKKGIFVFKKNVSAIYRTNYNILGKYRTITEPFKKKTLYTKQCSVYRTGWQHCINPGERNKTFEYYNFNFHYCFTSTLIDIYKSKRTTHF
jgi:hypothetical protein